MAAVISPHVVPHRPAPVPGRPHLVVLPGGRQVGPSAVVLRRRRLVALAVVVLLGVGAVCGLRLALGALLAPSPVAAAGAPAAGDGASVVVAPGDTYWSIARRLQPSGDVRALVDALVARNGGAPLLAGQRLSVPA